MEDKLLGIHHITVLASDPQRNYDYYTNVLGLRLVKKTINFDVPDVYHLYYGDEYGSPGTILTFFPFPDAAKGKRGAGEISKIAFSIPTNSFDFWMNRFADLAIPFDVFKTGENVLSIMDPDGMMIDLVPDDTSSSLRGWTNGEIPAEHSIKKFFGVTMQLRNSAPTENLLLNHMGFILDFKRDNLKRYLIGKNESLARIDIVTLPDLEYARNGAGSVHHIAWRTAGKDEQKTWQTKIEKAGLSVTDILDRNYFESIYFRAQGGVLFEIATDPPGFTVDENLDDLGMELKLPQWYESKRDLIEKSLLPLKTKNKVAL